MVPDTRPGSGEFSSVAPPEPERALYVCDCQGYRDNWPEKFCLRCLEAWVSGLPGVMSGKRLQREMERAARILAACLKDDPVVARQSLNAVLQAAEDTALVTRP